MALSQLQQDLQRYAEGKLFACIKDSVQAFDIAGQHRDVVACLGAMFMKAAAMLAVNGTSNPSKEMFLRWAAEVYDSEASNKMKGDDNA